MVDSVISPRLFQSSTSSARARFDARLVPGSVCRLVKHEGIVFHGQRCRC